MSNKAPQPSRGRKAPLPRSDNFQSTKGDRPAALGVYTQKKKEAYKSIPKAKRVDAQFGVRKLPGGMKTGPAKTRSRKG